MSSLSNITSTDDAGAKTEVDERYNGASYYI
jgi:hypothetical protein